MFLLYLALFGLPVWGSFSETSYSFSVREDASRGTIIGRFPLKEGIEYRPSGLPTELRIKSGQLILEGELDREASASLTFSLISSHPPSIIHILLKILDTNDNPPSFPLPFQNVSVLETAKRGTRLGLIAAEDPDEGQNGKIVEYKLHGDEVFRLVEEDGLIFLELNDVLDREEKQLYSYNLTAKDGGEPMREGWTVIYVSVLDVNDCAPRWLEKRIVVNWNGHLDTPIATLNALDDDVGQNSRISYEILGGLNYFELKNDKIFAKESNPACCELTPCSECLIAIQATDGGNPPLSSMAEILVKMKSDNQHDPEINIRLQSSHVDFAVISPESEAGKAIAVLSVTDKDGPIPNTGDALKIVDDQGLFELKKQSGAFWILRLARNGSFFSLPEYWVEFEATDGQKPLRKTKKQLTVYSQSKQTTPKRIVQLSAKLLEDSPPGSFVIQLGGNSTNQRFELASKYLEIPIELDEINGIVTTSASPLIPGRFIFEVAVFPPPPAVEPYIITVDLLIEDVNNHAPEILILDEIAVEEQTEIGAMIMKVEVVDKDLGSNSKTSLSIISGSEYFKLEKSSIILKKSLDYEKKKFIDILLEAVDHGKPPLATRKRLHIIVKDSNDHSPFFPCSEAHFSISTLSSIGTEIGRIDAIDEDDGKVYYSLLDPTLVFTVNKETGMIATAKLLESRTYKLRIRAMDQGGLKSSNNVTVYIHSSSLSPPSFNFSSMNVKLKRKSDSVAVKLNGKGTFSTENHYVSINSLGEISIKNLPQEFPFWVSILLENNGLKVSKCLKFHQDLPSLPPKFKNEKLELKLSSNIPLGSKVERVEANCMNCEFSTDCPFLSIDEMGILRLARIFSTDSMFCNITVKDREEREDKMAVVIMRELDDGEFRLPSYHEFSIYPSLPLGTIIGHLPASSSHFYSLKNPSNIGIFPDGVLYIRRNLKELEVYSFIVVATHRRLNNRHMTEVWVRVGQNPSKEINCPKERYSVKENNLAGSTIAFLDYPSSIIFRQLDNHDKIIITPIGRIQSIISFDVEILSNFSVKIELSHGIMKKVCSLKIEIEDENEFFPVFERNYYSTKIPFDTSPGRIGTVKATDADKNGKKLTYSLKNCQEFFQINETSGEVFIRSSLPSDASFNLSIQAIDSGDPPRYSFTFFLVSTGEDSNVPIVFKDNSTIRISPSASIGSIVGQTIAASGQKVIRLQSEDPSFSVDSYGFIRLLVEPEKLKKSFEVDFITQGYSPEGKQTRRVILSDSIDVSENTNLIILQSVPPDSKIRQISPSSTAFAVENGKLMLKEPLDREKVEDYQILLETGGYHTLLNIHVTDQFDSPPVCGTNVFLLRDFPSTIRINCWDQDLNSSVSYRLLKQVNGITVESDGSVRVEHLEEVMTKIEMEVADSNFKPISTTLTLLKNHLDPKILFPAENFTLLLSSSLENGQSFGRVAAEASNHLDYFLLGSSSLSVDPETAELIVKNYKNIQRNPQSREVTLLAASRVGIASAKIRVEIIEDALYLPKNIFIFQGKSRLLGSFVGEIKTGRKDLSLDVKDDRFFLKENQLYVKKSLKNETSPLLIEIEATKGRISSKLTVYIILPQNKDTLEYKISENLPKASVIGKAPEGFYKILEHLPIELRSDGILQTTQLLDREKISQYNFNFESESGEFLSAILHVEDENDNLPIIMNPKITVKVLENEEIGVEIVRIDVKDPDSSNFFSFIIEEGNEMDQFEMTSSGQLVLKRPLDYEKERNHILKIRLEDGVAPFPYHTSFWEVQLVVLDVNDSPPRLISSKSFTVLENSPRGTTIGTISAEDLDSSSIFYRIVPDSLPYGEITVDPIFGYLQINKELDYESKKNLRFLVEISDGELMIQEEIRVEIIDVNDNAPKFKKLEKGEDEEIKILEIVPIGYAITRFDILDSDSEDNSRCQFWLAGSPSGPFRIGKDSGIIYVAGKLDYEKQQKYTLTVQARNLAEETTIIMRNLTILLEDVNDESPRFLKGSPQFLEVYEDLPGPFPMIISYSVSEDEDAGDAVAYSLLTGNSSLFGVDTKTGDILLLGRLDREEKDKYELVVVATDSGRERRSTLAEITIHILDSNDNAPTFPQPYYSTSLHENVENGTEVIQLSAEDLDIGLNSEITYRLLDLSSPFWINPSSGKIIVKGKIDREEKDEWVLKVEAKDGGKFYQLSSITSVRIKIEDMNDNPPVIRNLQMDVFVDGKAKKGEVIHVVDSFDPDHPDNIILSLSGPDAVHFDILKNGEIVSLLDTLLMKSFYTLMVTAEDSGRKTTAATFTFYVDDAIFPRFFPILPVQIQENLIQNVAIFNATTIKPPPLNTIQYSILAGNDDSFEIGQLNGILSIRRPLNREKKDFYKIWIKASDSDVPPKSSIQSIEIRVLDQNDKKPEFGQPVYHVKILENEDPQELITVSALDEDLGKNAAISYSIIEGNDDGLFSIDPLGVVKSLQPLDRESASSHRLIIRATDNGSPPLSEIAIIEVEVLDEDDNSPKFTRLFHAEIPEDIEIGSPIILVSATDLDSYSNHNFTLEDDDDTFSINRTSGLITLVKPLDREKLASYRLRVRLEDGVWTIFTSVQITILDVNDNEPIFDKNYYIFKVEKENESLGIVTAIDSDDGLNSKITYSLLKDNPYVSIDAESGELRINRRSLRIFEKLIVVARDSGLPSRASNVSVWILFDYIHLPPLEISFVRGKKVGEIVWKGNRNDDFLLSSSYLSLSNSSIRLSRKIEAWDNCSILVDLKKKTIQSLFIKLLDSSNSPRFNQKEIKIRISEDQTIGAFLGKLEITAEEWKNISVDSNLVELSPKGSIFLKKELTDNLYNVTVTVEDLQERKDTAHMILERDLKLSNPLNWLSKRPFIYIGHSICLQNITKEVESLTEGVYVDQKGCLEFNGEILERINLSIGGKRREIRILDIRKMRSERLKTPIMDQNLLKNQTRKPAELVGKAAKRTQIDLHPRIIFIRENLPSHKITYLTLQDHKIKESRLYLTDDHHKLLFSIQDNLLISLGELDREQKSFYSLPVKDSGGKNHTVRIIVDDILDSSPLQFKNLTVILYGQLKTPAIGKIHPGARDIVHNFTCVENDLEDVKISSSCSLLLKRFPDSSHQISTSNGLNYDIAFQYKRLRLLRPDSALYLNLFGPEDGIAAMFKGLQENFPDLKLYPSAIFSKEKFFYQLVMGLADRHEKIVSIKEVRSVLNSFLSSNPVVDLLPLEASTCLNYSSKIVTTGRHLSFRGTDSLFFIPEGRLITKCLEKDEEILKIQKEPEENKEFCSKRTCPDGICSIEKGKVVCLRGEEKENTCQDPEAIYLSNGHLELLPTTIYRTLLKENNVDCNDSWISFDFRTKEDGSLILLENIHGFKSSLEIIKGIPTYRLFDGYRSPVEIPLTQVVSDEEWHTLNFKMTDEGTRILLEVDGIGREAKTKTKLPMVFSEDLKRVQIGADGKGKRFTGCIRRILFNNYSLPLLGFSNFSSSDLFSISAVGHITWSSSSSSSFSLSPSSIVIIAAALALLAVLILVYFVSRLYFKWKDRKEPAWKETKDINAITVRIPPKINSTTSTTRDSMANRRSTELSCFERAPTLPARRIRTVADVPLEIPRTSTPKIPYYQNEGYV